MPEVAIVGAGPIGASIAHRLAERGRVRSLTLVDGNGPVAAGKALDIRQCGPVQRFDTVIDTADDPLAATPARIVVIADDSSGRAAEGEQALGLVRQLLRAGCRGTLVFACPSHTWLMEAAYRDLGVETNRLVGSAPAALRSAVRAVAALELGLSSVDLAIVGRPPRFVIGWSAASTEGAPLSAEVPAHRMLAISDALRHLWPSGPYAIASATAPIVEALLLGSRHRHYALTIIDGELDTRGSAVMLPLLLGRGLVLSHGIPALSAQERTELITGVSR